MADLALETRDLWFSYPGGAAPALRGVEFHVQRGQSIALVGANGSGKTTLVKQFNGLLRPQHGEVRVGGRPTAGRSIGELARQVGFLFQHPEQQIFASTVRDEVAFGPRNLGLPAAQLHAQVDAALERFGLEPVADSAPAILSYGQRRRVTLASLAALDTPTLILDEPTVGLDLHGREMSLAWLAELQAQGRTVVLVTHDMTLVAETVERVVVLGGGQLLADSAPADLFGEPDLLARASLVPPPVFRLSQLLAAHARRGDASALRTSSMETAVAARGAPASMGLHLTVDTFVADYVHTLETRAGLPTATFRASPPLPPDPVPAPVGALPAEPPAGQETAPPAPEGQEGVRNEGERARIGNEGELGGYRPGDSWLHGLDPRTKMWLSLLLGAAALTFHSLGVLTAILIISHLLLLSARTGWEPMRWLWARLWPLLALILVLQPLFAPGPGPDLWHLGPLRLTAAGLLDGVGFALRAAALAFSAALLFVTTDPSELVQGLVKLGLPYPWGLTVGLAVRYLPTTYGLFTTISEAQQARGWILERGGPIRRARAYLPILVATVIAALRLSDNLGLALAARGLGYPARRTTLHAIRLGRTDVWALLVVTGIFAGAMYARFGLGLGSTPGMVP